MTSFDISPTVIKTMTNRKVQRYANRPGPSRDGSGLEYFVGDGTDLQVPLPSLVPDCPGPRAASEPPPRSSLDGWSKFWCGATRSHHRSPVGPVPPPTPYPTTSPPSPKKHFRGGDTGGYFELAVDKGTIDAVMSECGQANMQVQESAFGGWCF